MILMPLQYRDFSVISQSTLFSFRRYPNGSNDLTNQIGTWNPPSPCDSRVD